MKERSFRGDELNMISHSPTILYFSTESVLSVFKSPTKWYLIRVTLVSLKERTSVLDVTTDCVLYTSYCCRRYYKWLWMTYKWYTVHEETQENYEYPRLTPFAIITGSKVTPLDRPPLYLCNWRIPVYRSFTFWASVFLDLGFGYKNWHYQLTYIVGLTWCLMGRIFNKDTHRDFYKDLL